MSSPNSVWMSSKDWMQAHDPNECPNPKTVVTEQGCCDHGEVATSSNVLDTVRANELLAMSRINSVLAIISVLYTTVNLVCTILNYYTCDSTNLHATCSPATTGQYFHNMEFWATFVFNTVDVFAISYSPKMLSNKYASPTSLKLTVLFNVGLSFLAAILVYTNLERFEVPSHEIEYLNEVFVWIFDVIIFMQLVKSQGGSDKTGRWQSYIALGFMGTVVVLQFLIYNCTGWKPNGGSMGEKRAHFLEFLFGVASSCITFWFTMDNKMSADQRLRQLMYGSKMTPLLAV